MCGNVKSMDSCFGCVKRRVLNPTRPVRQLSLDSVVVFFAQRYEKVHLLKE
jgi:hypothetical protein